MYEDMADSEVENIPLNILDRLSSPGSPLSHVCNSNWKDDGELYGLKLKPEKNPNSIISNTYKK